MRPASAQAVAEDLGVSRGSLYKWKNQLLSHEASTPMKRQQDAPASSDRAELEQQLQTLQRDIRRLQLEKDVLKKANDS
jgi:transposase-like protein